jgi:hypothetical protein
MDEMEGLVMRKSPIIEGSIGMTTEEAHGLLNRYGYFAVPNFLAPDQLHAVRRQFDRLLEQTPAGLRRFESPHQLGVFSEPSEVIRLNGEWSGDHRAIGEGAIGELIASPFLSALSRAHLESPYLLAARLQILRSRGAPDRLDLLPYRTHYDRVRTLKFYFNLDDARRDNGAFEVLNREGVIEAERLRAELRAGGGAWHTLEPIFEHREDEMLPIEAAAGTLVVFDSSQPHRHGHIMVPGDERNVLQIESQTLDEIAFGYNQALAARFGEALAASPVST